MKASSKTLATAVARIGHGDRPDDAVAALSFELDGDGPLIPENLLVPPPRSAQLDRAPSALLVDLCARACVDAGATADRLAVFVATRLKQSLAYQRLGYRTEADYAREQLGISPRAFRDLARLGERLERLPRTREAFLEGQIGRVPADSIGSIATDSDEAAWLAFARDNTVRALKKKVREARAERGGDGPEKVAGDPDKVAGDDAANDGAANDSSANDDVTDDETRAPLVVDVPARLLGKIDAVLDLAARVAGAQMPRGALWELIAAEYLSGVPPTSPTSDTSPTSPTPAAQASGSPEASPHSPDAFPPFNAANSPDRRRLMEKEMRSWPFLPRARAEIAMSGAWLRVGVEADRLGRAESPEALDAWELHDRALLAFRQRRRLNWQLGRLLALLRNRRLWRDLGFADFGHYLAERLGISSRHAERLIRADRAALQCPEFAARWQDGAFSALRADTLTRVLSCVARRHRRAWIELAERSTVDRFARLVRTAERLRRQRHADWVRSQGCPHVVRAHADRAPDTDGGSAAARDLDSSDATVFVTRFTLWLTPGERSTVERALAVAGCVENLLDAFVSEYGSRRFEELRAAYPVFERDGWQCRAPGCRAFGALHAHHIVFRSRGGGDEHENLVTLCDFHHRALHRSWIRVVGRAPAALYWELGVDSRQTPLSRAPVARFWESRRLRDDEYWDGAEIRAVASKVA